ncbi:MAG: thiosulfate/3-mercaptopyruvate sulfurtransferase [Acidimicrobiales bacterium]|jgi:thiosulfate/3-mercaptopyruvate sulfurtransferase
MQQLVSTGWLADRLGSRNLVVLDCTVFLKMGPDGFVSESGRDNWALGQIPGAGFADLNEDLVDASSPHRYALPTPREFADAMQNLGVANRSRVVLYDDNGSMWAARVWWMLRWIGFDNVAILDGGLKAWKAVGHPVTTDYSAPSAGSLFVNERPETIADKAEVLAAIEDGSTCLIDALSPASFSGEVNAYGRAGHIPTARNASASALIDEKTGCYLPLDELRSRFPDDESARVVNYCGGGIAASSTAFVQTLLGFDDVAVYTASLQEWANDADAPMTIEG